MSYPDAITGRVKIGAKVAVMGAGGIGFDVTESAGAHPGDRRGVEGALGRGRPGRRPRWCDRQGAAHPEARGVAAAAQGVRAGQGPGQDQRLGAPHHGEGPRRAPGQRRVLRQGGRRRPAHHRRRPGAGARRGPRRAVHRSGVGPRPLRRA
ncbi:hypothetical protein [Nocardioides convexus]|uniref:hypothetical protein n=1 Tax=Nocardioides convexus TaxID=2712224 RepID=UPI00241854D1|nr:hypothetical protein [Nocardioides convexus]